MNILQVIPYYPPAYSFGGPVTEVKITCENLVKKGHNVVVFSNDALSFSERNPGPLLIKKNGVYIFRFPNLHMLLVKHLKLFVPLGLYTTFKKISKHVDVVDVYEYRTFMDFIITYFAKRYNIPYIIRPSGSVRYNDGKFFQKRVYDFFFGKRIFNNASNIKALSMYEKQQIKRIFKVPENKITLIPPLNVTNISEINASGHQLKKKYGIYGDKKILLYLGRIHKQKGIDKLILAFSKILAIKKDVYLFIVGPDDGFQLNIMSMIKELDIGNNIILTGPLFNNEKYQIIKECDIFVLPSLYEAFSRSIREAMFFEKPVISTRVEGLPELVIDGKTGLLTEPGNIDELASAINYLLDNPKIAKQMGKIGKKYLLNKYSNEYILEKLMKIYNDIILKKL